MSISITILNSTNRDLVRGVAAGVFDHEINVRSCQEFLDDPRHHLAVAVEDETIVGMASGVHYVHPDKEPELWINEVGVAPTHQRRGLGSQLVRALLDIGQKLGCTDAWVLTERTNTPAMRLYTSCGGNEAACDQVMFTFKLR